MWIFTQINSSTMSVCWMVTEGLLGGPHPFRGTTSSFNDFTHGGKSRENYRGDPGESKHIVMFFV